MVFHVISIFKLCLGTAAAFLAVMLWSRFKRFTSGVLSITALLIYALLLLELMEDYRLFNIKHYIKYGDIPLGKWVISILVLISLLFTLIVFIKEEKK